VTARKIRDFIELPFRFRPAWGPSSLNSQASKPSHPARRFRMIFASIEGDALRQVEFM
jgi:hypothetical protein